MEIAKEIITILLSLSSYSASINFDRYIKIDWDREEWNLFNRLISTLDMEKFREKRNTIKI